MKFSVSVSKWMRGGSGWNGALLESPTGQRCCLGFACKQAGVKHPLIDIDTYAEPMNLWEVCDEADRARLVKAGLVSKNGQNTSFSKAAMMINDEQDVPLKVRQSRLQKLAKKYGHIFKFTK